MADALSRVSYRTTPQAEQARQDQVPNNAGGYAFKTGDQARLNRFLTLGTEGGTYYVSERELTRQNAKVVTELAIASNPMLIEQTVAVSQAGRAPRNNAALFALAAACSLGGDSYRKAAFAVLPKVVRTGSHMLTFVGYAEQFRGWGPQMVRGIQGWYLDQEPARLAYQLLKYQQRDGWAQRDVLRLCGRKWKFRELTPVQQALFAYAMKGETSDALAAVPLVEAVHKAHRTASPAELVDIIHTSNISWEMLPSESLARPEVWRALFDAGNLPLGALLRNLARMTTNGALTWNSHFTDAVCVALTDPETLRRARIHPVAVLLAMKTYAGGHSLRGKGTWTPLAKVTDALNDAFYASFRYAEPSGRRTLVGLDVSGSMDAVVSGLPITCREVTAAMAMTQVRTEPHVLCAGFTSSASGGYGGQWGGGEAGFTPLNISVRQRLDDVVRTVSELPFGGTDCALPMVWALRNKVEIDTFQVWTDNETWAGNIHPHQALRQYRERMGIDARLQVIGITATDFTIADPLDLGQLDVAGFDAAVPALLADHARGNI